MTSGRKVSTVSIVLIMGCLSATWVLLPAGRSAPAGRNGMEVPFGLRFGMMWEATQHHLVLQGLKPQRMSGSKLVLEPAEFLGQEFGCYIWFDDRDRLKSVRFIHTSDDGSESRQVRRSIKAHLSRRLGRPSSTKGNTRIWAGELTKLEYSETNESAGPPGHYFRTTEVEFLPGPKARIDDTTTQKSSADAAKSNFGTVSLRRGFVPDPRVVSGKTHVKINASGFSRGCTGWVSSDPDHILELHTPIKFLRIFALSSQDTTLAIRMPDGKFRCNDKTFGHNPSLEGSWPAGVYSIWVGRRDRKADADYELKFTENKNQKPFHLDLVGRKFNFGSVTLRAGFVRDPHRMKGKAGGDVDARHISDDCSGWVSHAPSHVVTFQTPMPFLRIFSAGDLATSLVVYTPDGRFLCDKGGRGRRRKPRRVPAVDLKNLAPGRYLIWVGSIDPQIQPSYSLGLTQNPSTFE